MSPQTTDLPLSADPGLYHYCALNDRPKITWPEDARIAFWVAPNIEFYELEPPANPLRASWPRPLPDVLNYSHRDYGNRVGHWRMMEAMERCGVRGSVSLSVSICEHHPEIIEACVERDWEFFSHGVYNTRYTYEMDEAQERALIEDCFETVEKHTGQRLSGWLSPALTNTVRTMDLLAEYGIDYTCDLFHDDQPQPVKVKTGRLISVPYSLEMNDFVAFKRYFATPSAYADMLKRQFDQLYLEGEHTPQVMCIPLHPFLIGQPHRIGPFTEALEYITGHDKVWVTTAREIAAWYYEHHYDHVLAALQAKEQR
jgi:allantoinase